MITEQQYRRLMTTYQRTGVVNDGALKAAARELTVAIGRSAKGEPQYGYLVQRSKEIVGRALLRRSKSRPLILPVVLEL